MFYSYLDKLARNSLDIVGIFDGEYAYRGPDCVQIDLTNNCNNNCIACWCNSPLLKDKATPLSIKEKTLDYKLVIRLIDKLANIGTRELYFRGGGEPCMHPRLLDILSYAKIKGLTCHLHTNFTLMDEEKISSLIDIKLDNLVVSLWAATPETYVLTHPNKSKDDFQRIKKLLKAMNQSKSILPKVRVYNVISNINYLEIIKMIDFALDTCCDEVEFTVVDTIPDRTDSLLLDKPQVQELLKLCKDAKDNSRYYIGGKFIISNFEHFIRRVGSENSDSALYDKNILDGMPCYVGWLFARILADGNVNSCLKSHRFPIGNLYQEEFDVIWNNNKQRRFRKSALNLNKDPGIFSLIGNDSNKEIGCYKSCDDLGRNIFMHNKVIGLNFFQRNILRCMVSIKRLERTFLKNGNSR